MERIFLTPQEVTQVLRRGGLDGDLALRCWVEQNNANPAVEPREVTDPVSRLKAAGGIRRLAPPKDLEGVASTKTTDVSLTADPEQMVSSATAAKQFGLTPHQKERLRKRLKAWRCPGNCREWTEVPDAGPRQPKYLYRLGSVRRLIDAVKDG